MGFLAGVILVLTVAWSALFMLHMTVWAVANPREVISRKQFLPRLVSGVEIVLFVTSVVLGCAVFLGSGAFPAGEAWINQVLFGGTVISWIVLGLLNSYRRKPLREIPMAVSLTGVLSIVYLIVTPLVSGASSLLAGMMFGTGALLQNMGPILVGCHVLVGAAHLNRIPVYERS